MNADMQNSSAALPRRGFDFTSSAFLIVAFLTGIAGALQTPTLSLFLTNEVHVRPAMVGFFFTGSAVIGILVSQFLAGRSDRKGDRKRLIVFCCLLGAAAAAQIPLTHRDHSSAVSFVAGQCKGLTDQDWSGLAGQGRTLVIYMGVATADAIADKLMADGVAPDMPVAVLERATLTGSRAMRTLRVNCIDGIEANEARLAGQVASSVGVVTALTPYIGYTEAATLAHIALTTNESIAELVVGRGLMSAEDVARVLAPPGATASRILVNFLSELTVCPTLPPLTTVA